MKLENTIRLHLVLLVETTNYHQASGMLNLTLKMRNGTTK